MERKTDTEKLGISVDEVVQAGVAVIDVDTGKIVAIGNGRNKTDALTLNYASGIKRQI